jgi:hypothetical protein
MVRLPDECSADSLRLSSVNVSTFSHRCPLSVSIYQLGKADALLIPEAYIYSISLACNATSHFPMALQGIPSLD